jgi:hypothetical protein
MTFPRNGVNLRGFAMTRRVSFFVLVATCLMIPACAKVDKRITKANFGKINTGMSVSEVEAILGPGEPYEGSEGFGSSGAAAGVVGDLGSISTGRPALRWMRWGNDYTYILVLFDRADKVHSNEFKKEKGLK